MAPLPEHGKQLDIVADMVKVLLRHLRLRFDSYPETAIVLPEQGRENRVRKLESELFA